jgi:intraflagellar transport protein 140
MGLVDLLPSLLFAGTIKQTLAFEQQFGTPTCVDVNSSFLAVCTNTSYLKIFKIGGREARPHAGPSLLQFDASEDLQNGSAAPAVTVVSIRVNCTGQLVSALLAGERGSRETRIFVYSSEGNIVYAYDFAADKRVPLVW